MRIISVDPGANGAVAVIENDYVDVHSLPECPIALFSLLKTLTAGAACVIGIENVGAMAGQGVSSMFKFGRSLGVIEGVVGALGITPEYVSPQTWIKAYPSIGATKEGLEDRNARRKAGKAEALRLAREFYPELTDKLKRQKDDGRADALLLGKFLKELKQ